MNYRPMKRSLDLALSGVLLLILLPLIAVVAILALIFQGRPIFFVQVRPGLHGRLFRLVKFRTMVQRASLDGTKQDQHLITRFGRILRSLSIDELPQLWNILRGDMSFVGPRPLLTDYLDLYSEVQKRRHNVRPGLTGLAQVDGRNLVPWERRLALDVVYADKYSLAMDIMILVKTVGLIMTRRGVQAEGSKLMPKFQGSGLSGSAR